MWPDTVLFFLLLQVLTTGTQELPPNFSVLLLAQLWYPSTQRACVLVNYLTGPAELRVELQTLAHSQELLQASVSQSNLLHCFQFQVPPPAGGLEEVATVTVIAQGSSVHFKARTSVLVKRRESRTFIQTDKPTYQPGQTVNLRFVSLDENFLSSTDKYPLAELQDPDGNRIGQWLNVLPQHGIVNLSFPLSAKPALGIYTFSAGNARHTFTVEASELQKYHVVLQLPPVTSLSEKFFQFNVCAWHTYGKPVQGLVKTSVCHRYYRNTWYGVGSMEDPCQNITGKMDRTGCFSAVADMETLKADVNSYLLSLEIQATVKENTTGTTVHTSGNSRLTYLLSRVSFEGASIYYQSGLPYRGMMKLTGPDENPLKGQTLHLTVQRGNQLLLSQMYETDDTGAASFMLDTNNWGQGSIELQGWYQMEEPVVEEGKYVLYHEAALHTVIALYTSSKSVVQIQSKDGELACGQEHQLHVDYIIDPNEMEASAGPLDIAYFVVAKGGIVQEGQKSVGTDALQGSLVITLSIMSHMAPKAHVLVYATFPNQRAMADSTLLQISKCFQNKVTLEFSAPEVLAGSKVNLQLQAAPGSICAVHAEDKSLLFMKPEAKLTAERLYDLFKDWYQGGHPSRVQEPDPCSEPGPQGRPPTIWFPPWYQWDPDINTLFKNAGLKILTNIAIIKPVDCSLPPVMPLYTASSGQATERTPYSRGQERVLSQGTWLWSLYPIGSSGNESIPVTAPNTITDWEASIFCTGDTGFGVSPTATLRTVKPFFVDMILPDSMVRGERCILEAAVLNYLPQCIKVHVTLGNSSNFQVSHCPSCSYSRCLCNDESTTFSWNITATGLGEINLTVNTEALDTEEFCDGQETVVPQQGHTDTLIRTLLVRPEGVLVEKSHSSLLCLEESFVESVSLEVPDDVVEGSARASMSVLGDIMGPALHNLDKVIQMPSGCGEQNMVTFLSVIYVLQYLEQTLQLTDEIKTRASHYLINGYQQQLTYKHSDGSYSAFGKTDEHGSIWLTASVAKSFGQARPYIAIDQQIIKDAVRWLRDQQLPSGCFTDKGDHFQTAMKDGMDGEKSLTAQVMIALLEMGVPPSDTMVSRALSCLKASAGNQSSLNTQALLAYSFSLTGDVDTRELLLNLIDQQTIHSDGQIHWQYNTQISESEGYWAQPLSFDIQLTSNVLLAILFDPDVKNIDIEKASVIVRWLIRWKKAYFSPIQDTVVALQALAKYAALTFIENGEVTVTVTSTHGFETSFLVDNSNRLLLQQASLPEIPGHYEVQADGTGCVLVLITLRYNVPPPMSDVTFSLSVETEPQDCADYAGLLLLLIHVRYTGNHNASKMTIIEVAMLSGYSPGEDTEQMLLQRPFVKKVKIKGDTVSIYLDELDHASQSYSFYARRETLVENLQPGLVKVYEGYQPEENAVMEYSAPC